jgi:tetratricopeptide (TPR) repeat protein
MRVLRPFLAALGAAVILSACTTGGPAFPRRGVAAVDAPPQSAEYRDVMIARFAALTGDHATAARRYARLVDVSPDPEDMAERALFSALLAGEYGQAVGLARRANTIGRGSSLAHLTLSTDAFVRGRASQAAPHLALAEFGAFNRHIARNLRAWMVFDRQGASAGIAELQRGFVGDARLDAGIFYMMGLMRAAEGQDEDALVIFRSVWDSGARMPTGIEAHARLLAALGRREEAVELIESYRQDVGVNSALTALQQRIKAGEAIRPLRPSTREGAALAIFTPAAALFYETEADLAAIYFVLILALDPQFDPARLVWASTLESAGRMEEALEVLAAVRSGSDHYASARGQSAAILLELGRGDDALKLATEALAAYPDRNLVLRLADIFRQLERHEETESLLSDLLATDAGEGRSDWRVLFARGAVRERLGRWPEAEADLQAALALQPENAAVLNYLGYSWVDRGVNLEEGLSLIRRAVALAPRSGHIVDSLGWAYYRLGDYERAIDYLEQAVALMPGDPILNDHLGDAYWMAGRRLEAGFQWRRALTLDPAPEDRALIERKLVTGPSPDARPTGLVPAPR